MLDFIIIICHCLQTGPCRCPAYIWVISEHLFFPHLPHLNSCQTLWFFPFQPYLYCWATPYTSVRLPHILSFLSFGLWLILFPTPRITAYVHRSSKPSSPSWGDPPQWCSTHSTFLPALARAILQSNNNNNDNTKN